MKDRQGVEPTAAEQETSIQRELEQERKRLEGIHQRRLEELEREEAQGMERLEEMTRNTYRELREEHAHMERGIEEERARLEAQLQRKLEETRESVAGLCGVDDISRNMLTRLLPEYEGSDGSS
ncbi:MAG: hypothetical protein K9L28_05980 [Synergistales bacterium]|nr:hypothetical protein [Synergistales bacterium]